MAPSSSNTMSDTRGRAARTSTTTVVVAARGGRKKRTTKNKARGIIDRLLAPGKRFCRMSGFNWNVRLTLDRGIARLGCEGPESLKDLLKGATEEEKLLDKYWDILVGLVPDLSELVLLNVDSVEISFDYSKTTSRSEDNHKLKIGAPDWRTWTPPLPKSKDGRGLGHPECARMLCPISVNFADPVARDEFILNHNPPATHHIWMRCLYAGYTGDVKRPKVGLLRSQLIIKAAQTVMLTPSETDGKTSSSRGTRPGFADTHSITAVTRPFMAYVAMLLRYMLSSDPTFNVHSAGFDYGLFYDDILEYLDDPKYAVETNELVDWWNVQIFPVGQRARRNPNSMGGTNMFDILEAAEGAEGDFDGENGHTEVEMV